MKIEFQVPEKEETVTEHIVVDGQPIGEMLSHKGRALGSPYHAIFRVPGNPCMLLLQGHGMTKEEAIKAALYSGRKDAEAIHKAVEELEVKLFGQVK